MALITVGAYIGIVVVLMPLMMGVASPPGSPRIWRGGFTLLAGMAAVWFGLSAVAAGLLLGGVALWGWGRKRMVFGVVLTVIGACGGITAIPMALTRFSPEMFAAISAQGSAMEPEHLTKVMNSVAIGGLLACAVGVASGVPLIRSQMKSDRRRRQLASEDVA